MNREESVWITMVDPAFYDSYNCCDWIESKRKIRNPIFLIAKILVFLWVLFRRNSVET